MVEICNILPKQQVNHVPKHRPRCWQQLKISSRDHPALWRKSRPIRSHFTANYRLPETSNPFYTPHAEASCSIFTQLARLAIFDRILKGQRRHDLSTPLTVFGHLFWLGDVDVGDNVAVGHGEALCLGWGLSQRVHSVATRCKRILRIKRKKAATRLCSAQWQQSPGR